MAKKQFAPPVTNFSVSCDPGMVAWLNSYAYKNKTSRSKIVRRALIDFRAEHQAEVDDNGAVLGSKRCIECDAIVIRQYGMTICTRSSAHKQDD